MNLYEYASSDPINKTDILGLQSSGDVGVKTGIDEIDGIKIINLHSLAKALKPLMHSGELLKIKMQRLGKEEQQGVGYLEDGTMVVVKDADEFIDSHKEVIVDKVLQTSAGRMIFASTYNSESK